MSYEESFRILRLHTLGRYNNEGFLLVSSTDDMIIIKSPLGSYCFTSNSVHVDGRLVRIEIGKCFLNTLLSTSSIIMRDLLENPAYKEFYSDGAYGCYYFEKRGRIFHYNKNIPAVMSVPIPEVRGFTVSIDYNISQQEVTVHTLEEFVDIISNNNMKSARFFE